MSTLRWILLGIGAVILLLIYYFDWRSKTARNRDVFGGSHEPENDVLLDDVTERGLDEQFNIPRQAVAESIENKELDTLATELSERIEPTLPPEDFDPQTAAQRQDEAREDEQADTMLEKPVETAAGDPLQDELVDDDKPAGGGSMVIIMYVVAPEEKPFSGRAVSKAFHAHKLRFGELNVFHRIAGAGAAAHTVFSVSNMLNPGTLIPDELEHTDIKGLSLFMKLPGPADPSGGYDDMLHCAKHLASTLGGTLKDETLTEMTQEMIVQQRRQLKRNIA